MDGEAIRRLEEMALKADMKEKDGVAYVSGNYKPLGVVHDDTVRFTTLQSLCDYIKFNPRGQDFDNTIIVINPDFTVSLLSAPDKLDGQRTVIAYAKRHDTDGFMFGKQYDMESFVVALKSKFVKADSDWETVFNVVRKVRIVDGTVANTYSKTALRTRDDGLFEFQTAPIVKSATKGVHSFKIVFVGNNGSRITAEDFKARIEGGLVTEISFGKFEGRTGLSVTIDEQDALVEEE